MVIRLSVWAGVTWNCVDSKISCFRPGYGFYCFVGQSKVCICYGVSCRPCVVRMECRNGM